MSDQAGKANLIDELERLGIETDKLDPKLHFEPRLFSDIVHPQFCTSNEMLAAG